VLQRLRPTSRKEREKWGTLGDGALSGRLCGRPRAVDLTLKMGSDDDYGEYGG
jgi:hypothetical protein